MATERRSPAAVDCSTPVLTNVEQPTGTLHGPGVGRVATDDEDGGAVALSGTHKRLTFQS